MDNLIEFLHAMNRVLWSPWTLGLILVVGFHLSIKTGWLQIFKVRQIWENTFGAMLKKETNPDGEGEISSFQALATAMSACLGVGTIVGVATAIATGGPGAIFWMWVAGFFAIATKYAELTLAVHFRKKNAKDEWVGGPMYYASHGLGKFGKVLAVIFSISVPIAAVGIGNMVQANSVAEALETAFNFPRIITGLGLAVVVGAVTIGGVKKLGAFAGRFIPLTAIVLVVACLSVLILNIGQIPAAFVSIISGAFTAQAATGGFLGATIATAIRMGVTRGIFSNEGGLGSAPIAHATATTNHPVKQGLWGAIEVFMDTHVMCTLVALVVLTTGAWQLTGANGTNLS